MNRKTSLIVAGLMLGGFTLCGCGANAAKKKAVAAPQDSKSSKQKTYAEGKSIVDAIALDTITLVESIPKETEAVLDNADIPNAADLWPKLVSQAQKSIDWAMFYASEMPGDALTPVVKGIFDALERGVKVRIVADESFTKTYPETLDAFEQAGALVHRWDIKSVTHGVMHAKYFIIDGKIAYIGSQNFDYRSLVHVYETGIMVENEEFARRLTDLFNQDFEVSVTKADPDKIRCPKANWLEDTKLQIQLTSTPTRWQTSESLCERQELVSLMGKAKDTINIQVLQYSPVGRNGKDYFGDFDEALRHAAARGVQVNLIVSDWSTKKPAIDWIKSLSLVPNITVKIITIPQFSEGFIDHSRVAHSKYMTIDNRWSWVGSSNWEKNYFTASRNVGAIIRGIPFTKQLAASFNNVWNSDYCHVVDVTKDYIPPQRTKSNN